MNITLHDVSFTYPAGVVALREVNLTITSGEAIAIIGENGAGKTTLAKHLNGLLKPERGRVHLGDWDTREHTVAQLARRVGYAFQNPDDQLFERTVWAEVAFGPRNLGQSEAEVGSGVEAALSQVGLEAEARHHPYDLHISQRKLVALAAILAMRTPVVILDEPTTGQDARGLARIGGIVEALKAEGRTVITISHDIDFCAEHFERVVVMSRGRVLGDGPAGTILAQGDLLARAHVEPPQLARLAAALGLADAPCTLDTFTAALATRVVKRMG
ncbi:MAG: energy-coupling factor ABC transporter ATP-binding protein [Anaerolineae bacterium]